MSQGKIIAVILMMLLKKHIFQEFLMLKCNINVINIYNY